MGERRLAVPGTVLRRAADPENSPDPEVRELVGALRSMTIAPPMRDTFRSELRTQLVAVTPRLVNEGMDGLVRHTPESLATAHLEHAGALRRLGRHAPRVRLARPVRVATATLTIAVMVLSGAVWLARGALPGEPLYHLKRASENAQISMASGTDRATDLLAFARTRVAEVMQLLSVPSAVGSGPQATAGISDHTASLVTSTLDAADDDLEQASLSLTRRAVRTQSSAPLSVMTTWAPVQHAQLARVVARIPAGSLHERAARSADLVTRAQTRAAQLRGDLDCGCLATSGSDALGPLPCDSCATPDAAVAPHDTLVVPPVTASSPDPGAGTVSIETPAATPARRRTPSPDPTIVSPRVTTPTPTTSASRGPNPAGPPPSASPSPSRTRPHTTAPTGSTSPSSHPVDAANSPTTLTPPAAPTPVPQSSSCGPGITLGPIQIGGAGCGITIQF